MYYFFLFEIFELLLVSKVSCHFMSNLNVQIFIFISIIYLWRLNLQFDNNYVKCICYLLSLERSIHCSFHNFSVNIHCFFPKKKKDIIALNVKFVANNLPSSLPKLFMLKNKRKNFMAKRRQQLVMNNN